MISSLLNNETDIGGVEQTKLALAILTTLTKTMGDSRGNSDKFMEVHPENYHRSRYSSGFSEDDNHETDEEDSSSYTTADDHLGFSDRGTPASDDSSDDTMKTSMMDIGDTGSSTEEGKNLDELLLNQVPNLLSQNPGRRSLALTLPVKDEIVKVTNAVAREVATVNMVHSATDPDSLKTPTAQVFEDFKRLSTILSTDLQKIFDCFKLTSISIEDCEALLKILRSMQHREDFQWALYQLGDFNAILFLYGRVLEICDSDRLQAKYLSLVLSQMKYQKKIKDVPEIATQRKELVRFLLNSSKSNFGFQTFMTLIRSCLNLKGSRMEDYELFYLCLVSSWKRLLVNRCSENDAPSGSRTLFECLLQITLDLVLENGVHRDLNVGILKANKFPEMLLAICTTITQDKFPPSVTLLDATRIVACVKSILIELMAPADGNVAVAFIRYGLLPLLPKELPPIPQKSDAFFIYHGSQRNSFSNLNNVLEGEEVSEEENEDSRRMSNSSDSGSGHNQLMGIDEDIPKVNGTGSNGHCELSPFTAKINNVHSTKPDVVGEIFQEGLLEAIMSTLLSSIAILPDEAFRKFLEPNVIAHIFVAYCSHPKLELKGLGIQLLTAYLNRVKNPITTEFIKSRGFFLASYYTQGNPELAPIILQICSGFGPLSYALINGLIYSNQIVSTVLQWIQHDENGVISSLLSMGFLPSVINFYNNNQQLPRTLVTLLTEITKYLVLRSQDDQWKILFCSGIESAPSSSYITSRILQDATEILRTYSGKELKKSEISTRLLWLLERCSCSRIGQQFDKWLLKIYAMNVMEMDESEETEGWKYFIKNNKRRLNYLMGIFLCRILAPNQGDLDFKQYVVRCLILSCYHLSQWFPKVIRSDDQIQRCFTAFTRIFMSESEMRVNGRFSNGDGRIRRRPSFHSLISSHGNLVLTLRTAAAVGLPNDLNDIPLIHQRAQHYSQSISDIDIHLSDRAIRSRFEGLLIDAGILSPTNNFTASNPSLFSSASDFKTFRILLEATPISGVSHSELRQCLTTIDKMRMNTLAKSSVRRSSSSGSIKLLNNPTSIPLLTISNSAAHFESIFASVHAFSLEVVDVVTRMRTKQEIEVARRISVRDADITAKENLWNIRQRLTHPKAPWHFPSEYPKFWSLDQCEGPSRVRMRLRKEPLKIHTRFLKTEYQETVPTEHPLDYLFQSDLTDCFNYPVLQSEVEFIRFCIRIIPGEELPGEVILSGDNLYFFCETCHLTINHCHEKTTVPRTSIYQILRRRYTLEDRAAEIFINNRSYFFVFRTQRDREDFIHVFSTSQSASWHSNKSLLLNSSLTTVTAQWVKGNLSNFDYLMYLNTAAGRTYCDLMQYPVFPFVLCKYNCPTLDLMAPPSYRDLRKPMAIQDPVKEDHFVSTYNYLKRDCISTPYHYGSHYSNSGIVLHFLVRLPPYTQHFLKYQDGSFDLPDRSFHNIETTWKLASKDSNTDFKEAIPEFFYLPEFLQNLQHFDLGIRQNENRVDDVNLPPWAKNDARIFTLVNRQALESQEVRRHIGDWIDLIFGYKQTGKPAVQAINVFHPSTYEGFKVDEDGADDVIQRARKAMVSTYGQTPKRLFPFPHPKPQPRRNESCNQQVIDTIYGVQWGYFLGSPASPDIDVVSTRDYREPVGLFESASRIVFWPVQTLILSDSVVGSWDSSGIRIKSNIIYLCVADEITTCNGMDTTIWVGHQSGRISVLKLSSSLDVVLDTIELIGHYQPIKIIELNQEFSVALSCSGESYVMAWDMNRISFANIIEHTDSIDFVHSSKSTGDIVLLNREKNFISLRTINGFPIGDIRPGPDERFESVCLSSLDPGRNVNLVAVGNNSGIIKFYSTWDVKFLGQCTVIPVRDLPIQSIRYSRDGRRMYCMSQDDSGKFITVALQLSATQKNPPISAS